jgi:hypothetical protein
LAPAASDAGAAVSSSQGGPDTVKAVVVRSWGRCSGDSLVWDDLNANWADFGPVPITIDYSDPDLCDTPVTYDALVASGADVMILSDPGGTPVVYSETELEAIRRYALDGHNIIGTYILFGGLGGPNVALAPLFGFKILNYGQTVSIVRPYRQLVHSLLFRNVPNPYQTEGYPFSEIPPDGRWSTNELRGAVYLAKTGVGAAVISVFDAQSYSAIRITSMPEYFGGTQDKQFLYNAITFP